MEQTESRWRRRRRGYAYLAAALGLFGFFLIIASLWPRDWSWVFAVSGFASFVLCTRHALALWNIDQLVFDRQAPRRTPRASKPHALAADDASESKGVPTRRGSRALTWESNRPFSPGRGGIG